MAKSRDRRKFSKVIGGLVCIAAALLMHGCGAKDEEALHKAALQGIAEDLVGQRIVLKDLISAHPAKLVSSKAVLEFEFSRPMVPSHLVGADLPQNPIDFKPELLGRTRWLSSTLLRFTPDQPMPAGQAYQSVLLGKKAFGQMIEVDDFSVSFQVAKQEIVDVLGDYAPVSGQVNQARLEVELRFAQPVDLAKLKEGIKLKEGWSSVSFDVVPGGGELVVKVVGKPIARENKGRTLVLTIDEDFTADGKEWSREFYLAAKGEFKVITESEAADPNAAQKTWAIRFSDAIALGTDLTPFVTVEPAVPFKAMPQGKTLRLKGDFVPGRAYTVTLLKNLPSAYGTKLAMDHISTVQFSNELPAVEWVGQGVFLPLENQSKLQLRAMNLSKIRLEVQEILPQNVNFFLQNNDLRSARERRGNDYDDYDYYYGGINDLQRVAKVVHTREIELPQATRNMWHKVEMDLAKIFQGKTNSAFLVTLHFDQTNLIAKCVQDASEFDDGDLLYEQDSWSGNPCREGYYYGKGTKQRILVSSSIGLTAKKAGSSLHIWASDLAKATPMQGLSLDLYSYQNELLETKSTDANGLAVFEKASEGFVVRGKNSRGFAVLKLNRINWETSRFDTDGASIGEDGMRVFTYADRGVHRPGDTVSFSVMVRSNQEVPPADMPVILEVHNVQGQLTFESQQKLGEQGLVAFRIPTETNDPTGTWTAKVKVGGGEFHHGLRIETVKPNRLKVLPELPKELSGLTPRLTGVLEARWLFGTPAAGLRAEVEMIVQSVTKSFPRYPEFVFHSPLGSYDEQRETILDESLDDSGRVRIDAKVPDLSKMPEAAVVKLQTKVYEKGGDYTENWSSVPVDPYPVYVGTNLDQGWYSVKLNDTVWIPIVALNTKGKPVAGRKPPRARGG